jgi:tetratricopeptide (TPR) repeat protein
MTSYVSLVIAVATLVPAAPAPVVKQNPWVGRVVMAREPGVEHGTVDEDGNFTEIDNLRHIEYTVVKEKGDYLELRQEGKPIWVEKSKMVRLEEALDHYTKMIDKDPEDEHWFAYRGWAYNKLNRDAEAIKDYTEAIRLKPGSNYLHNNRGVILRKMKKFAEALDDFDTCVENSPNYGLAYRNRAQTHSAMKKFDKAIADYETAHKLEPDASQPLNGLAWLYATAPDDKVRDGKKAVEYANKACEMTDWKNGGYIDTLAAAYAEVGQFDKAVEFQDKAIKVGDLPIKDIEAARKRLELFKSKKPYRSDGLD